VNGGSKPDSLIEQQQLGFASTGKRR